MKKSIAALFISMILVPAALAATAFKTGESTTGQTKQCFYDFAGSTYTLTIKSYEICPLSVEV